MEANVASQAANLADVFAVLRTPRYIYTYNRTNNSKYRITTWKQQTIKAKFMPTFSLRVLLLVCMAKKLMSWITGNACLPACMHVHLPRVSTARNSSQGLEINKLFLFSAHPNLN